MRHFDIGDKAVYPAHGVAEIVGMEQRDYAGSPQSVYVLKILESGLKIIVPLDNATAVGLREIISEDEAEEVYSILRSTDVSKDTQTWNRRYREYTEKIRTGSVFEIAEVLRDLCRLQNSKDLSYGERDMLGTARKLLVKELALAQHSTENEIEEEIKSIFHKAA